MLNPGETASRAAATSTTRVRCCPCRKLGRICRSHLASALGFTLVELLVVIAIIGLLISILLPALGKARAMGRQTRELAGSQQTMTAMAVYANDSRGLLLPGYPTRAMVNGRMQVTNQDGQTLQNEEAQRYPWRLAPYLDYNFRGLYQDDNLLQEIRRESPSFTGFGVTYDYVVSLFPSMGMNIAFVGGSDRHQGFDPFFQRVFGKVYIERIDEALRPSGVMAFVSARSEVQASAPGLGKPEGFFRVEPPRFAASQPRAWQPAYDAKAEYPGLNSGFVSLRHAGKAVGAHLDGHSAMLGWDQLNDMRRWSDKADGPDWGVKPR